MTHNGFQQPPRSRTRPRVLLVDDDDHVREFQRTVIEDAGYSVAEAANGRQAVEFLRGRSAVAVIVLDLMMPEMDGFAVLEHLEDIPSRKATPVVVVSARHDPGPVLRTMRSGAADHIRKPFTGDELIDAIERAIAGDGVEARRSALSRAASAYSVAGELRGVATAKPERTPSRRFLRRR